MKGTNIVKGIGGTEDVPMDTAIVSQVYMREWSLITFGEGEGGYKTGGGGVQVKFTPTKGGPEKV